MYYAIRPVSLPKTTYETRYWDGTLGGLAKAAENHVQIFYEEPNRRNDRVK
jgi:hypothetical protein